MSSSLSSTTFALTSAGIFAGYIWALYHAAMSACLHTCDLSSLRNGARNTLPALHLPSLVCYQPALVWPPELHLPPRSYYLMAMLNASAHAGSPTFYVHVHQNGLLKLPSSLNCNLSPQPCAISLAHCNRTKHRCSHLSGRSRARGQTAAKNISACFLD